MTGILRILWPGSWLRWVAAAVYLLVIAVIVAVVVLFLFVRGLSQAGEATAEFFPSSTIVYVSVNLRPGITQIDNAREVGDLLRTDDFIDEEEELLEEVEDETGIHPLDDVTSWLGTDITFAILDIDEDEDLVEWVLMAQVSDQDEAYDFVEKLRDYLEDELYTDFDEDEIGDADAWISDDEDVVIGLTGDYLLLADSEDTLEDMLDYMDSPPERSLADDEQFMAARDALPEGRVMFVYAEVEDHLDAAGDIVDELGQATAEDWLLNNAPEWAAASLSFIDKGVRFDVVSEAASSSLSTDSETDLMSAEVVPEDTLLLLSYSGLRDAWDEFRDTLEDEDPWAAEDLDEFLAEMEDEIGVDLERDVIESLTGEMSMALLPSDVRFSDSGDDVAGAFEILFVAGLHDAEGIEDALDSLTDWLEDEDIEIDRDSIGDYDAVTLSMDQFDEEFLDYYEAGYVITDDWLVLGSTVDSLESFQDVAEGGASSLNSSGKYSELAELAPSPLHLLLYADIAGIVEMVVDGLDEDDLDYYEEDVRPFVENLSAFMVASSLTDERWRFTAALTLED